MLSKLNTIPSIVAVYASCRHLYRLCKTRFRWLTKPCRTGLYTCGFAKRCFIIYNTPHKSSPYGLARRDIIPLFQYSSIPVFHYSPPERPPARPTGSSGREWKNSFFRAGTVRYGRAVLQFSIIPDLLQYQMNNWIVTNFLLIFVKILNRVNTNDHFCLFHGKH